MHRPRAGVGIWVGRMPVSRPALIVKAGVVDVSQGNLGPPRRQLLINVGGTGIHAGGFHAEIVLRWDEMFALS